MKFDHDRPTSTRSVRSADPIGAGPAEWRPPLGRERLRQDQEAIERVGEAQTGGNPERQPRLDIAQEAAERGSEDETRAKGCADLAEHGGALVRRRQVGDIGKGGRDTRRGDAGDHPPYEQPGQRRRERHQHVVRSQPEIRHQHHGPASEPIRQRACDRREDELHQRPGGAKQAEDARGLCGIVVDEAFDELWQDRNDDAERQHVEQDRDKDEGGRRAVRRAACWRADHIIIACHDPLRGRPLKDCGAQSHTRRSTPSNPPSPGSETARGPLSNHPASTDDTVHSVRLR
jgi:hypothetical protein